MLAAEDSAAALQWTGLNKRNMELVDAAYLYRHEKGLAPGFESALWMPDVSNIRNPRLLKALIHALELQANVRLHSNTEVIGFSYESKKIVGARVRAGNQARELHAQKIVICAGAWSSGVLQDLGITLKIEPVKGQMLLYEFEQQAIQSILLHAGRYLIPRKDGHVLIGSTLESCGFDKSTTEVAQQSLLDSGCRIFPGLKNHKPVAQWSGLRPAAPEGIPFVGKLDDFENLYINAGQFRNGLVLAPASARLLADELLGRNPILDPAPYKPGSALAAFELLPSKHRVRVNTKTITQSESCSSNRRYPRCLGRNYGANWISELLSWQ
jgi:glycine oxidase